MFEMPFEPECGMLCMDHDEALERAYEIVGVEEVGRRGRWNLTLERIDWVTFQADERKIAFSIIPRS